MWKFHFKSPDREYEAQVWIVRNVLYDVRAGPRDVDAGGALKAEILNRAAKAAARARGGGEYERGV